MPPTPQAKIANCEEVRGPSGKKLTYTQMDQRNREKMYENQQNQPGPVRNQNVKWYLTCGDGGDDDDDSDLFSPDWGDPDEAIRVDDADL